MRRALLALTLAVVGLGAASTAHASCDTPGYLTGTCDPLRGGERMYPENGSGFCTAGFIVQDGFGSRYILTAGHCLAGGLNYWGYQSQCHSMTSQAWSTGLAGDYGIIYIGPSGCESEGVVQTWHDPWKWSETELEPIGNSKDGGCAKLGIVSTRELPHHCNKYREGATIGRTGPEEDRIVRAENPHIEVGKPYPEVCYYGREEEHACGEVVATNLTVELAGQGRVEHLMKYECWRNEGGSSGSPIVSRINAGNGQWEAVARGILVAGSGCPGYATEIEPALAKLGVSIVTAP